MIELAPRTRIKTEGAQGEVEKRKDMGLQLAGKTTELGGRDKEVEIGRKKRQYRTRKRA